MSDYIHKYDADGKTFYLIGGQSRPGTTIRINNKDWLGRVQAKPSIVNQLNSLKFIKEEEKKEEEMETKEAFISKLDRIASDLESEGRADLAIAIDRVSDHIEGK